jgi:hypothetical protein
MITFQQAFAFATFSMCREGAIYFKPINFFLKGTTRKRIEKNTMTSWSIDLNVFVSLQTNVYTISKPVIHLEM